VPMGLGDGSLRLRRNERPVLGFAPPGALCGRRFPAPAARCVAGAAGHCSAASIGVALPPRAGRDSPRLVQAERARAPPGREARRGRRVRRARARPAGTKRSLVPGGHRAPCAVAITIDDGFHSTAAIAVPLLRAAGLPATVYVTTYYVQRDVPVFRLAMQYCFWKTRSALLDIAKLGTGEGTVALDTDAGKFEIAWELINYGELHLDEKGR